ncbi:MAG TPA: glycosyltransferase family 9 protein [Methylomusa anaerophila]|uniref:ADP-heptose--LPS heptosyltransferase 2 n=1 Tax=Methylomusa anaerophila TaxID=1930071 RepID=A0A348AKJ2_9FIRM|nr:glycosyltransferase family 9 protein [Methylomusa anaerophila]BBB91590.1 ADP-heptose--LPS heptosyltransferase 2 [Methylomusa anaerophila]HML89472.1 glycosyltransferase family 9 protein [Methylomusa anaerophila]
MEYGNILLSCTLAIGDAVMATSAAALLKKIYPQAKTTIIVKRLAEEIVRNNPVIDEVIALDYVQKRISFKNMTAVVSAIKKQNFDLYVSLDGKIRPALLACLAGIPVRIGPTSLFGSNTTMPLLITRHFKAGYFQTHHYTAILQDMIRSFTGSSQSAGPVLPVANPQDAAFAKSFFNSLPKRKYNIGLCVKTNPRKTWPQKRFAELLRRLHTGYDANFFIIGGSYDKEYVEQLVSLAQVPVMNLCGATTLTQSMELLKRTDLFITLDTAPMHIASALGVPMIAIFGSTAPASVAPLSNKAIIAAPPSLPCIPCIPIRVAVVPGISKRVGKKVCEDQQCMQYISVSQIEEMVSSIL